MAGPTLACRFFRASNGTEPVRDWLLQQPLAVRKEVGSDIKKVQWRWPVSRPLVGGMGQGIYEVRTALDGNIYRVLFLVEDSTMVLLHAFMKKTPKTPPAEIAVARRRRPLNTVCGRAIHRARWLLLTARAADA